MTKKLTMTGLVQHSNAEREIDEVAVSLGLARKTPQHGIMYWRGTGQEFRRGYVAGREAGHKAGLAESKLCKTCNGHGLIGNSIDQEECPECTEGTRIKDHLPDQWWARELDLKLGETVTVTADMVRASNVLKKLLLKIELENKDD